MYCPQKIKFSYPNSQRPCIKEKPSRPCIKEKPWEKPNNSMHWLFEKEIWKLCTKRVSLVLFNNVSSASVCKVNCQYLDICNCRIWHKFAKQISPMCQHFYLIESFMNNELKIYETESTNHQAFKPKSIWFQVKRGL